MGEGGGGEEKGSFFPSPLFLFRFHSSPFPQKRLILRLTYLKRALPQCHLRKGNPPNYTIIKRRVTSHSTVILINRTFVVVFLPTQTKDNFSP